MRKRRLRAAAAVFSPTTAHIYLLMHLLYLLHLCVRENPQDDEEEEVESSSSSESEAESDAEGEREELLEKRPGGCDCALLGDLVLVLVGGQVFACCGSFGQEDVCRMCLYNSYMAAVVSSRKSGLCCGLPAHMNVGQGEAGRVAEAARWA
jgi:hypothetical protein